MFLHRINQASRRFEKLLLRGLRTGVVDTARFEQRLRMLERSHHYHRIVPQSIFQQLRLVFFDKPPKGFEDFFPSSTENEKSDTENFENAKNGSVFTDGEKLAGYILLGIIGSGACYMLYRHRQTRPKLTWREVVSEYLDKGSVEKFEIFDKEWVRIKLKPGASYEDKTVWFKIGSVNAFERNLLKYNEESGINPDDYVPFVYNSKPSIFQWTFLITTGLLALSLAMMRNPAVKNATTRKNDAGFLYSYKYSDKFVKPEDINVKFKDVAGCEEAKVEIMELVNFLRHPQRYEKLGATIPKGALLTGPPGTGKTLLAKATAGEAGVPFLSVAATEFRRKYVGSGTAKVRSLFSSAREQGRPCIIFIDEIDAIGRKRSSSSGVGSDNEQENTLNQLLVEMDGFDKRSSVVVLAATNRGKILDDALLRPGRFDRQIDVGLPDIKGRASIFKLYLVKSKTSLNKEKLARKMAALTPGFSGADIGNVCNEAALICAREAKKSIEMQHFDAAIDRAIVGIEKKSSTLSPSEKKVVAYHEAGHAICGWFLEHAAPLTKVSIIASGNSLGYAMYLPKEQNFFNKEQLFDRMCVMLGGRCSESIFFNRISTGAQDDLQRVTNLAYDQVVRYGMNKRLGPVSYGDEFYESAVKPYGEETAAAIDEEVKSLIDSAYEHTMKLLQEKKENITKVAEFLLANEKLKRGDIINLIGERPFKDKTTYEEFVEDTGSFEEDTTLPEGLKGWNEKSPKSE